jgi:hypothetical protein
MEPIAAIQIQGSVEIFTYFHLLCNICSMLRSGM